MIPLPRVAPDARPVATDQDEARAAVQAAAWRRRVGLESPEGLVDVAVSALVAGLDAPALAELAGADPREAHDVHDLFVEALGQLGLVWADERTALWQLVRSTARQIVDGEVDPYDGAGWIWRYAAYDLEPEGDLRVFIGLASAYEDLPADGAPLPLGWPRSAADDLPGYRDRLRRDIVRAAEDLLARAEPRRWLRLSADADRPLSPSSAHGAPPPLGATDLPVLAGVAAQVDAWRLAWREVDSRGGFDSREHAVRFVEEGRTLAASLQDALGDTWVVEYWPEPTAAPGLRLRPRGWRRLTGRG
jgi:hypothetical protein